MSQPKTVNPPRARKPPKVEHTEGVGEIPPEPAMSKELGDRTPAWAEWCRRYEPERFARHFHELRPYEE